MASCGQRHALVGGLAMGDEAKWLAGIGLTVTVSLVTALIAAFRSLAGRVSSGDRDLHKRIDDVKDKYVRRDDLDDHVKRIETNIRDLRDENRENHKQILAALTKT